MTRTEIHARLLPIFRETFDDANLVVSDTTVAADVPGWDSLSHINLVVAVEKEFGIRFTTKEVRGLENVGDLVDLVDRHTK